MGDLIYRLLLFLNDNREENLNYTIALTMLHNIKDIPNMQINKLASLCYTSPSAISRFCRKLGYSSLSEFKENLSNSINNHNSTYLKPKALKEDNPREEILNIMYSEINNEILETKNNLNLKLIDRVLELIYHNEKIYIFGTLFSQLMAQELQIKFANLGKFINISNDIQGQEKLADSLDSNSLAILISPSGRFIYYHEKVWDKIKKNNPTIITITENRNNYYKDDSNYIIYLAKSTYNNLYASENNYSLLFLTEYIFARYVDLYFKN